jgi:hypothetical protein
MLSGAENVTWITVTYMKEAPKLATKWIFGLVNLPRQPRECKQITSW